MSIIQSIKQGIRIVFVRPITQPFFEAMHFFSIRMMNYGNALFENTGEIKAFQKVALDYLHKEHKKVSSINPIPFTAFDVGANKGGYAKACLDIIRKTFTLSTSYNWYSFEPAPNTYEKCKDTLKDYPDTKIVQLALSDNIGIARFRVSHADFLGTNGLLTDSEDLKQADSASEIQVPTTTIDQYIKDNNILNINFLKVDAEGFDLNVLKGAKESISEGKIDAIQFEYGYSANSHFLKDYIDFLSPYYTFYRILPGGLRRVKNYSLDLEVPHGINYLCLKK